MRAPIAAVALCLVSLRAGADPEPPPKKPTTVGSMAPGVYLEEVSLGFRDGTLVGNLITSPHDPKVMLGSSADNHLFRSDDDGHTFQEIRLPGFGNAFFGDGVERYYPGALRPSRSPSPSALLSFRSSEDESGGEGGQPAESSESVVGARIRELLTRAGKPAIGRATVASTLRLRGAKTAAIWFPEFHPTDKKIVWVLTFDGLFTSYDGGWTFTRTWIGKTPAGSATFWISVHPKDPLHWLLSTGEGLWVSRDGGRSYLRHPGQMIGDWVVYYADFHPADPRHLFASTDKGFLRSSDQGKTWKLIHWSTHPMGQLSRNFSFDEHDPDHAYIDTNDGLWETHDLLHGGLDSWTRVGGNFFTGTYTAATITCPNHPGHLWTMSQFKSRASFLEPEPALRGYQFIYESLDGGKSWKVLFAAQTTGELSWFVPDDSDKDLLLIFTDHAAFRMRRGPRPQGPPRAGTGRSAEPSMSELIEAALRNTGTSVASELQYRRRATWSALLPRIEAAYASYSTGSYGLLSDGLYPTLPYFRLPTRGLQSGEFRVLAVWDLAQLAMNLHSALIGREARTMDVLRRKIMEEVAYAYGKLIRLRAILEKTPPLDQRRRIAYELRIQEIRAYLGRLTGGIYSND